MNIQLILERLKDYYQMIRHRWGMLVLVGIVVSAALVVFAVTSQKIYQAVATFHPDPGSGSSTIGSLGSDPIALLFGGNAGKTAGTSQMMGVLVSRRISEDVARDTLEINGQRMLTADAVLDVVPQSFSLEKWLMALFYGPPKPLTLEQKVIIIGNMLRNSLEVEVDDYGFIEMKITFSDPVLLQAISNNYIERLSNYYNNQKTEKASDNVIFFEKRSDSVKQEIDKNVLITARFADKNKYGTSAATQIQGEVKQMELEMLGELYKVQMMSLEQAKGQKQQNTPIIQILDYPDPPYFVIARSPLLFGFLGLFLGIFFAALFRVRHMLSADLREILQSLIESSAEESSEQKLTDS